MAIPLNHYVYSSMGGYRTLYKSPSISKELSRSLEELSVHIYRLAHKHEVFACFRPDEQTVCLVRAFQNGTDHAGRIRRCVQSVVFSLGEAAGNWFFSPLQVPDDVFLSPEASLQTLQNELQYEYAVRPFKPAPPAAKLPHACLLGLLGAMMGEGRSVVLDGRGDALDVVRSLVWVLPPGVRKNITVSAGVLMPDVAGLGPIRFAILPAGARKEGKGKTLLDAADAVIEFPSGETLKAPPTTRNGLAFQGNGLARNGLAFQAQQANPYAEFVASNIHSEVGFERVRKLAALMERYPPSLDSTPEDEDIQWSMSPADAQAGGIEITSGEWTDERFEQLLEAFGRIEPDVEEFGTVNVRRAPAASLSAVGDLAAAGMHRLSLDILMGVSSIAISQHGFDGRSFQETVERLRSGAAPGEDAPIERDKLVEAVSYLAETLKGLLTAAEDGN